MINLVDFTLKEWAICFAFVLEAQRLTSCLYRDAVRKGSRLFKFAFTHAHIQYATNAEKGT